MYWGTNNFRGDMNIMNMKEFLEPIYHFFTIVSILVILVGFFTTIYQLIVKKINVKEATRYYFDNSVLVGLQILIVADIIETIIAPDLLSTLRVFAVVVIRTIMSFSLNWEMKNINH